MGDACWNGTMKIVDYPVNGIDVSVLDRYLQRPALASATCRLMEVSSDGLHRNSSTRAESNGHSAVPKVCQAMIRVQILPCHCGN